MINKNVIYLRRLNSIKFPKYLVNNFLLMHEIDKMWKIEKNIIQSHHIQKITKIFFLRNPYRRKPAKKVRLVDSLFYSMERFKVQKKKNSLWL
jgi:hypothetical protein